MEVVRFVTVYIYLPDYSMVICETGMARRNFYHWLIGFGLVFTSSIGGASQPE